VRGLRTFAGCDAWDANGLTTGRRAALWSAEMLEGVGFEGRRFCPKSSSPPEIYWGVRDKRGSAAGRGLREVQRPVVAGGGDQAAGGVLEVEGNRYAPGKTSARRLGQSGVVICGDERIPVVVEPTKGRIHSRFVTPISRAAGT